MNLGLAQRTILRRFWSQGAPFALGLTFSGRKALDLLPIGSDKPQAQQRQGEQDHFEVDDLTDHRLAGKLRLICVVHFTNFLQIAPFFSQESISIPGRIIRLFQRNRSYFLF